MNKIILIMIFFSFYYLFSNIEIGSSYLFTSKTFLKNKYNNKIEITTIFNDSVTIFKDFTENYFYRINYYTKAIKYINYLNMQYTFNNTYFYIYNKDIQNTGDQFNYLDSSFTVNINIKLFKNSFVTIYSLFGIKNEFQNTSIYTYFNYKTYLKSNILFLTKYISIFFYLDNITIYNYKNIIKLKTQEDLELINTISFELYNYSIYQDIIIFNNKLNTINLSLKSITHTFFINFFNQKELKGIDFRLGLSVKNNLIFKDFNFGIEMLMRYIKNKINLELSYNIYQGFFNTINQNIKLGYYF